MDFIKDLAAQAEPEDKIEDNGTGISNQALIADSGSPQIKKEWSTSNEDFSSVVLI
jgi:hypothetical protein